jgi:D-3-phosphoglycerate dehydrogenase
MGGKIMKRVLVTPRSFGKTDPSLWGKLTAAGFEVIRNTTGSIMNESTISEQLAGCDGVIIGVDPLTEAVLKQASKLRAISKYGVGVDNIDMDYCQQQGIKVSRTVGANANAVADFAMALMMAVARQVVPIDRKCRQADWGKITTIDLYGKTIGILGLGAIGRGVAARAQGFNMNVLAYDVFWDDEYAKKHQIKKATQEEIYQQADFISLHLPLLPETRNMIGAEQLAQMKKTAVLVNTARGGLIDEDALLKALKAQQIYGAGIDAFSVEPPENPDWFTLDNIVLGSHAAASTVGATEQMGQMAVDNLIRDLAD